MDPARVFVSGADSTITFRSAPEANPEDTQESASVIVCTGSVDNSHTSGITGLSNNHGKIECSASAYSIAVTTQIYYYNTLAGSGFNMAYGYRDIESTANDRPISR